MTFLNSHELYTMPVGLNAFWPVYGGVEPVNGRFGLLYHPVVDLLCWSGNIWPGAWPAGRLKVKGGGRMLMPGSNKLWPELSLEEMVGQLLMIGFEGKKPPPEVARFLVEGKAGGVILLARNFGDAREAAELVLSLQKLATTRPSGLPLLIAIDQEGGPVVRLRQGITLFPGNMAVSATGNPGVCFSAAAAVASELRALGINMNLAPVVDVNNNPVIR